MYDQFGHIQETKLLQTAWGIAQGALVTSPEYNS